MTKSKGVKRNNGEGSISRYGEGWRYQYLVEIDGITKRKAAYAKTEKEMIVKKRQIDKTITDRTHSDTKLTIKGFLTDYLAHKKNTIAETTYSQYRISAEEITEHIGKERIDKLTARKIETMLNEIQNVRGLSRASNCRTFLYGAYRRAIKQREVFINPVDATDPIKQFHKEMTLWEPDSAVKFLAVAKTNRLYALFYLVMSTGMRRSEVLGLRWVDVQGNTLFIRQTLVKTAENELFLKKPKTKKSYRTLSVTNDVLDVLAAHKGQQDAERAEAVTWKHPELVFVTKTGTLYPPDNLHRLRVSLMTKAEVPHISLHDMRHLHASILISQGTDPKTVADRLGHSRASFTLDRYTHQFDSQRNSAIGIENWLNPSPKLAN